MSVAEGFRNLLRSASGVTDLTGTFLERPSIFAEDVTPANFAIKTHGPYILIGAPPSAIRDEATGVTLGVQSNYRVRIYAGSDSDADALADAVEAALHGSSPVVPGIAVRGVIAEPSSLAPTENPSVKGRQIPIRLFYERA